MVKNIDYISEYVVKRNIAKKSLWDINDYKELNIIRVKISGNKLFKLMHGKEHRQFEKNGKLYADFLKEYDLKYGVAVEKQTTVDIIIPNDRDAISESYQESAHQ